MQEGFEELVLLALRWERGHFSGAFPGKPSTSVLTPSENWAWHHGPKLQQHWAVSRNGREGGIVSSPCFALQ